ncbi:nuclear transport factor 2 family protein [Clostridium tertium]|uniref:SnoaL-like domain-containing protein n=1 Tax=Clostridium tertium TaxID=1559 RepID=A0A6N3DCV0_9CLOT
MKLKEELIKGYFKSWINNEKDIINEIFSEKIIYSECYGPEYKGIDTMERWFEDWHTHGKVLVWDIKQFIHSRNITVVEWYFKCIYNENISEFDGVSIVEFDDNNKILNLKEFESKAEHYYPYS